MTDTVTVADRDGNEFEAEAGVDPTRPVSPDNPPAKAVVAPPEGPRFERHDSNSPSADVSKELTEAAEDAIEDGRAGELRIQETPDGSAVADTTTGPDNGSLTEQTQEADEPNKNASTAEWRKYAIEECGASQEDVKDKGRDELVKEYGSDED